jgi:hypothetical protein
MQHRIVVIEVSGKYIRPISKVKLSKKKGLLEGDSGG